LGTGKFETTPEGKREEIVESTDVLPKRYKSGQETPLRATVEAGKTNVFDFDLEG